MSDVAQEAKPDTCCGEGGSWAPKAGSARVVGCMLCPKASGYYWRDNRADGGEYREVEPLAG